MSHSVYREHLASHLITTSLPQVTCKHLQPQSTADSDEGRLHGKHFPTKFPENYMSKKKHPAKYCKVCNVTQKQRIYDAMASPSL